jgi:hypothetical protein
MSHMSDLAELPLQLSEIDYPPCWPDRYSLRIVASGAMLTGDAPGEFAVWLDEPRLHETLETLQKSPGGLPTDGALWLACDLAEAVSDFIAIGGHSPAEHLDWALHLELLAARIREGAPDGPE